MSKKIYFASDFHLGADTSLDSKSREAIVVLWLDTIEDDSELFLLGDIFDYWFEYKRVVPKGYMRLYAALVRLYNRGVTIHIFTGNHDSWMFTYFQEELGVKLYHEPQVIERQGKTLMVGHGDGLGPDDLTYKRLKKVFRNPLAQRLFSWIHPDHGLSLMKFFSKTSRKSSQDESYTGAEEWLVQYSQKVLKREHIDYFIFGHRHLVIDYALSDSSRYINIGDWMHYFSYAVMNEGNVELKFFKDKHKILS